MRKFISLPGEAPDFEAKLLAYAATRKVACLLRSNRNLFPTTDPYSMFEWCLAIDAQDEIEGDAGAFDSVRTFHIRKQDWTFGFLTYDLKNDTENLDSSNADGLGFPTYHFFQPAYIFIKKENSLTLGLPDVPGAEAAAIQLITDINGLLLNLDEPGEGTSPQPGVSREEYIRNVTEIKKHIQRGDIYEMNYCVEFFADHAFIKPHIIFEKLVQISPMPFSGFYKNREQYLMCASPERFIAGRGKKIISQPIKGTARRGTTAEEDDLIRLKLMDDEKEKSENVMIVDLVRNDLSKTAARNSVKVEKLFDIHTFKQLHQMISTVVSEMKDGLHWTDVIRHAFPMGSMTGAPKVRAMQLIEDFEISKRGLYSGAIGYATPDGDFDFNVVIRSILYNADNKYLSFMVGSAITINSDPEKEYDECMLKAKSMMQVLQVQTPENVS